MHSLHSLLRSFRSSIIQVLFERDGRFCRHHCEHGNASV